MFKLNMLVASIAVLSGFGLADPPADLNCHVGQLYCGFDLLNGSGNNFNTWKQRVDDALARAGLPVNSNQEQQTLFRCDTANGNISVGSDCLATPFSSCQPKQNSACDGTNDCCN